MLKTFDDKVSAYTMNINHTMKEIKILDDDRSKFKVKCSCGHTQVITNADRTICRWCGKWLYKNKQIEFRYKLKENIRNNLK